MTEFQFDNPAEFDKIDKNRLDELFGGDEDFKEIVFTTFLAEIDMQVADLKNALDAEDWENVGRFAHKIKPSMGMVGLTKTELLLKDIESHVKSGNDIDDTFKAKTHFFINNIEIFKSLVENDLNNK